VGISPQSRDFPYSVRPAAVKPSSVFAIPDGISIAAVRIGERNMEYNLHASRAPVADRGPLRVSHAITCQLDVRGPRSYELCIVPHWNPGLAILERYGDAAAAVSRQADIATRLREGGWVVIDHVDTICIHAVA
jgi:hypothetical protein